MPRFGRNPDEARREQVAMGLTEALQILMPYLSARDIIA